ncbi:MAG TPA: amidohydrolase family protein [Nitrospirota bacterium]|nr:amidohydrolase family protein [Nitrospirota bacterium]
MYFFDTLLTGGLVIDPGQKISKKANIGIIEPNFAEIVSPEEDSIETNIFRKKVFRKKIDVSGCYVVPGLIDFHTHIFRSGMVNAVDPEDLISHGVIATVDAGSIGCLTFSHTRQTVMAHSLLKINAVLNYSVIGLLMLHDSEFDKPAFIDETELARTIDIHRDVVLGIKIRFSKGQLGQDCFDILEKAQKFARSNNVKLFIHSTNPPAPYPELLKRLDKGDILIHMYHGRGSTLLNEKGEVWPEAWAAQKRGIIFDCAHGMSHFNFDVARKAIKQGFLPDIVSSDMTAFAFTFPQFKELPIVISELLTLGMTLEDIILRCTKIPASIMQGVISGIKVGYPANLTVIKIEEGEFEFIDSEGQILNSSRRVVPQYTFINGRQVYQRPE